MFKGLHHFHRRKRIYQKHEPYPHPDKWKNRMDKLIYVVGIAGPAVAIPQLMNVWFEKNTTGVSPITWSALSVIALFWLIYGIMHKSKPIIITHTGWIIINTLILIGIFIH